MEDDFKNTYDNFVDSHYINIINQKTDNIENFSVTDLFKDDKRHYYCKKCISFPLIKFNGDKVILSCSNGHKEEIDIKTYVKQILEKNDNNLDELKLCKNHKNKDIIQCCINCKKDLCEDCIKDHDKNHQIISLKELENKCSNYINYFDKFFKKQVFLTQKQQISTNSNKQKSFTQGIKSENLEYFDEYLNKNSEIIDIMMVVILDSYNYKSYIHYENIINIYHQICEKLELEYYSHSNNSETKIRLIGEKFFKKNKDKCRLLINGEIKELQEFYEIPNVDTKLNITLIKEDDENLTDMGYMFCDCYILSSISNNSIWRTDKVINMEYMFYNCKALISLPDNFSKWDTSNIIDMKYMFDGCTSLSHMPDVSEWKTINVTDMTHMFCNCEALESLDNIYKWNISKVESISGMFWNCKNLKSLSNIIKWETSNVNDMSYMLCNCFSLEEIFEGTDVRWRTNKVTTMSKMFSGCKKLEKLPEAITKWDTSLVAYMSYMFSNCEKLKYIPNGIENWKTNNVIYINNMFENCSSLEEIPNIKKWELSNTVSRNDMFKGCNALKEKPNFS